VLLWPQTITQLDANATLIRRARYGVIESTAGGFRRLRLRVTPTIVTIDSARLWGPLIHRLDPRDRCRLYYNQPLGHDRFLALKYGVSGRGCALETIQSALEALEAIAAIKQIDAIVCQVWNARLTERVMNRFGWERHTADQRGRHYIKRFYGDYPQSPALKLFDAADA